MASSKSVVLAALFANGAIAVLKFLGFLLTGSPAMLSETYHSISDTGNQIFLLVGLRYGERGATRAHPFGYGKAQFFYSFLVSVMLFGIAGWESANHGYHAIVEGQSAALAGTITLASVTVPAVYVNYVVLLGGMAFEGYAFKKAYRAMVVDIRRHDWSGFREAFRKTSNVTTLTAFTEDAIALTGLTLAFLGVLGTQITGNHLFDATAAFLIGLMLMGFAVALAWETKRLLLGESLPEIEERALRRIVADWDGVTGVVDFRTVYFGPEEVIVTADIEFEPDFDTESMDEVITAIEDEIRDSNPSVSKVYIEPEF
ncbi:cation diffusion facilitator family transporter [Halanaeroarchaeum sulfurireducens]|uniref:Cation diffusion facilitator family transporter n=1 Tax=Halanaeroarchaeum sulfurireducens TaxID=1604004 RepID=A0A0F7PCZ1_9EURY|nr:cation diffusion facilitator family transporter [Halanaeroarchaeum sulfurireducens]AKH98592.1 cation diffusion facilitator family transporter [Halanaeroarchaeum sulfurireducens]ALG83034.1 cation diffusion facilitator family transporter [Halanaeroarchaeum sulfurireducens]